MAHTANTGAVQESAESVLICKKEAHEVKVENHTFTFYESSNQEYVKVKVSQDSCEVGDWLIDQLEQHKTSNIDGKTTTINQIAEIQNEEMKEEPAMSIIKEDSQKINNDDTKENIIKNLIFEDIETPKADMYVCEECQKVFTNQYKLESHIYRTHRNKNLNKEDLDIKQETEWPPDVQKLACRVNGVKTFFCNLCSYNVTRCDSMNKHMIRVHSNGRAVAQFQCEVCGKTFIDKAYLRNHKVSHSTERMYKCTQCGRAFHRQPSLKRHQQSHSQEKQFACKLCNYKTNRKHLMYNHVDHHRKGRAYICQYCGDYFYTQLSFRSHIYTHNVMPHSCSICEVGFSSKERWVCHMTSVHFGCEVTDINAECIV